MESKVTIIPIASSSSGNSIYVNINDVSFLIDAGIRVDDISHNLALEDYSIVNDLDAVFVSHTHGDHIKYVNDVLDISNNAYLYSTIPVCNYLKSVDKKVSLDYYVKQETTKGLYVTAFRTYHDTYGSCGFVYEKDGIKIASLTDTGIVTKQILNIIKGSQIVIIESNHDLDMLINGSYPKFLKERITSNHGHLSNKQCSNVCKYLAENGTKYFLLAHLSEENNLPELALKETEIALEGLDTNIYVLPKYDGDVKRYTFNETLNTNNDNKEYSYCLCKIDDKDSKYWYLDENRIHSIGDRVTIPFGKKDKELKGTIVDIKMYSFNEIPFPLDITKRIID